MSTEAIAGVSLTLRNLLRDRMTSPPGITIAPPDVTVDGVSGRRLNLYLYHLAENGYIANQEGPGGVPPPLSLRLHYLVTAYAGEAATSPDADLQAQRVLGDAMRVLHDYPIVTGILHEDDDPARPRILDPSLLESIERIRISLESAPTDELAKVWSALPQANYRCSAVYEVTVAQIQSRMPRRGGPSVKRRRIHVATLHAPVVTAAYRVPAAGEAPGDPRVPVGGQLAIEGSAFLSPKTSVQIGRLEPIVVTPLDDRRIEVTLPDDEYPIDADHPTTRPIPEPDRLWPGPQRVRILTHRATSVTEGGLGHGTPGVDVSTQISGDAAFMCVPSVTSTSPAAGPEGTILTIDGRRLFRRQSATTILLGPRSFVPADPDDPASPAGTERRADRVQVRVEGVPAQAAPYPVRLRIDGAEAVEDTHTFQVTP